MPTHSRDWESQGELRWKENYHGRENKGRRCNEFPFNGFHYQYIFNTGRVYPGLTGYWLNQKVNY